MRRSPSSACQAVVCAHSSGGLPAWLCAAGNAVVQRLVLVAHSYRGGTTSPIASSDDRSSAGIDGSGFSLRAAPDAVEIYYNDCSDETVDSAYDQLITEPLRSPRRRSEPRRTPRQRGATSP